MMLNFVLEHTPAFCIIFAALFKSSGFNDAAMRNVNMKVDCRRGHDRGDNYRQEYQPASVRDHDRASLPPYPATQLAAGMATT
jgi:hypothetical protein